MGQQSNNDLKKCVNQFIIFLLSRFVSCAGHNNLICTQVTLNSLSITIIRLLLLLLLHSLSFGTNRNCPRGHHTQFIVDQAYNIDSGERRKTTHMTYTRSLSCCCHAMLLCAHHWTRRIGNWKRKEFSSANLITSIGSINVCGVGGGGWYHSIHCGSGRTNKPHSSQLCSIIFNTRNLNMLCFRSFTCDYYRRRGGGAPWLLLDLTE